MKRILILSSVVEKFSNSNLSLFGLEEHGVCLIVSTSAKENLNPIGSYSIDTSNNTNSLFFTKTGNKIICKHEEKEIDYIVIPYKSDFSKRTKGIIDISVLQDMIITIIGLGSGGSKVAEMLVRSGIVNLILIDHDIVETSNICRSDYSCFDIGLKKTEALTKRLLSINPLVKIETHTENWLEMDDDKREQIIQSSSLIVEATDQHKPKLLTNGLCRDRVPVIYPRLYDQAKGGDIIFTIPGANTPCYECIFMSLFNEMQDDEDKRKWDYTTDGPVSMPGLVVDINVVTCRAVKLSLAILMSEQDDSMFDKITEPCCNMLFVGNEKYYIFDKPFQEIWAETEINPNCSCQTLR